MRVAEDQASLGHRSDLRNGGSSIASPGVAAMTTARAPGRATPPCPAGPCPLRWRGLALRRVADYGWSGARGDQTPQDSFQDRGAGRDRRRASPLAARSGIRSALTRSALATQVGAGLPAARRGEELSPAGL